MEKEVKKVQKEQKEEINDMSKTVREEYSYKGFGR